MKKNPFHVHALVKPDGSADTIPGQGEPQPSPQGFDTLEALLDTHEGMGRQFYKTAKADQQHLPMIVCVCRDGTIAPVVAVDAFTNDERKSEFFTFMRGKMQEWNVVRYITMVEAWVATASTKDEDAYLNDYTPSQRADRKECFVMVAADKDRAIGRMMILKRNPHSGRVNRVEEDADLKDMAHKMGGRFSELLKPEGRAMWWLDEEEMAMWSISLDLSLHNDPSRFDDFEGMKARGALLWTQLQGAYRLQQSKALPGEGAAMAADLQPELKAFLADMVQGFLKRDGLSMEEFLKKAELDATFGLSKDTIAKAVRAYKAKR